MERKIFCIVIFTASFFFIIRKIHQRFIWALRRQSDGKVVDKLPRRRKFQKWRIDHPRWSSKFCLLHAFISLMHFTRSLAQVGEREREREWRGIIRKRAKTAAGGSFCSLLRALIGRLMLVDWSEFYIDSFFLSFFPSLSFPPPFPRCRLYFHL